MVDGLVWYSPTKGELRRYGSGGVAIIDQWIASHAKYFIGKMETCMCITFIVPMGQGYIILFCILVSFPILWPDQFLIYMSLFTSSSVAHSHLLILILYISNFNFLKGTRSCIHMSSMCLTISTIATDRQINAPTCIYTLQQVCVFSANS